MMKRFWKRTLLCSFAAAFLLSLAIPVGFAGKAHADPPYTPMGDKLGVNLPGLPEFVDAAKTANPFVAVAGQPAPTLDANGWPQSDGRVVIHDMRPVPEWAGTIDDPEARKLDMSGTYKLSFTGQADLAPVEDPASFTVQNKTYNASTNTTTADLVVPAGKQLMIIDFTNTRRLATDTTNTGITNMKVIRPGYASNPNQLFTDRYLDAIEPFSTIRAMDYLAMNGFNQPADNLTYGQGAVTEWSDRKTPDYATQKDDSRRTKVHGGAWEYLIDLANETGKDLWINIPVSATDDYIAELADLLKNGPNGNDGLDPGIHLYLEYSNEVWNWGFPQSIYNQAAAEDEVAQGGSDLNNDGSTDQYAWGRRRVAERTIEIAQTFAAEFGSGSLGTTLRPVLAWQFVAPNQFSDILQWVNSTYGAPSGYFYGIAAAPYIGANGASDTATPVQIVQTMWENGDFQLPTKQTLIALADSYDIKMLGYEGGPDNGGGSTTNIGNRILANRDPLMGNLLVHDMRDNWFDQGGDLFMYYNLYGYYSRYGSWGLTDMLSDLDTVKYNAALDIVNGTEPDPNPNVPPSQYTTEADPSNPDLLYGAVIGSSTGGMNYKALDRNTATLFNPGGNQQDVGLDLGAGNEAPLAKVRINTISYADRASGVIQGSNDGVNYTNLLTIPSSGTANAWNEYTVAGPTADYRYYRLHGSQYFVTQFNEIEFYRTPNPDAPLTGAIFGSAVPAMNALALDGDVSTVFKNNATYGYVGIDLGAGNEAAISKFRYYPDGTTAEPWLKDRTQGYVQGSNDGVNYTNLVSVPSAAGYGQWYEIAVTDPTEYRYFRWYGTQYFYTQVKEIQFIAAP